MARRQINILFIFLLFLLFFVLGTIRILDKKFPSKKEKLENAKFCVDLFGESKEVDQCGPKRIIRDCKYDSDCKATCGLGCIAIVQNKDFADCKALPQYVCSCIDGICQVR